MKTVSLTLQATSDAQPLINAIRADNPSAKITSLPSVVKIDCDDRLVLKTDSVSRELGRTWDPQELHLSMISISGYIDQDDDNFTLSWGSK